MIHSISLISHRFLLPVLTLVVLGMLYVGLRDNIPKTNQVSISANNGALEQSNADHPEQGMFKSDFGGAELIEKRTEYSKTYRNPDGSCGEKSGSIPMHFKHAKENCLLIIKNFINNLRVFFNAAEAVVK